ncbi:MAG: hypothetical protein ABMA64_29145 [Myxococcota bacterium]
MPPTPGRPIRRPLHGLSPYDTEAILRWALQQVTDEVVRAASVRPRLVVLCDDHVEDLDLSSAEGDPLAAFVALADRRGVEHRLLWGHVEEGGTAVAWAFGARTDAERSFWFATRPFRRLPGGLGSGETSWDVSRGVDLDGVVGPALALHRPGPPLQLLPAEPPPMPMLTFRIDPAPPGAEIPADPVAATNVVNQTGEEQRAVLHGLDGVGVFVFRGRDLERWHVLGEVPMGLDDLVRAICARGPAPSAVATIRVDVFAHAGTVYRAVRSVGESAGTRFERIAALVPGDEAPQVQLFGSAPTRLAAGEGWIGVGAYA